MKITKHTEQQLQSMNLIQPGQYPFEVVEAKDTYSKAGNEMIALKLKIWDENGSERIIFDYLLDSMAHKVKHFCDATGLQVEYENESLNATSCIGTQGYLQLIIQKSRDPQYSDKNSVKDYLSEMTTPAKKVEKKEEAFIDDDLLF